MILEEEAGKMEGQSYIPSPGDFLELTGSPIEMSNGKLS